jgi:ribosomal protein S18 acetylase RimI-like enzyme
MIELNRVTPSDWRRWRHLRLEALRESPQAFSSTLVDWQGSGDSELRWRGRLVTVPFNIIASLNEADAGMASGTAPEGGAVELISMWVAPFARGRGVADALVTAVIAWARSCSAHQLTLAVFEDNARAIELYGRHGFIDRGVFAGAEPARAVERRMVRDLDDRVSHYTSGDEAGKQSPISR